MSAVDDAIAELDALLDVLGPQYEGLKDYARLNLQPDSMAAVQVALVVYDRRVGLVATTRDMLVKLRTDGYPTITLPQVSPTVYADLQAQEATITAALGQFTSAPAAALNLSADAPEVKP